MIISEQQRRELDAYIKALEKFCAYSINEKISSFGKLPLSPAHIRMEKKDGHRPISKRILVSFSVS